MAFTIARINRLPKEERDRLYLILVPPSIFLRFGIDPKSLCNERGERVVQGVFPPDENLACIEVRFRAGDRDPLFACQVSLEQFMYSVCVDFVTMNDTRAERYNVDLDPLGRDTLLGSRCRNIYEEVRAMEDGLAPGQVRPGLGLLREFVMCLEAFVSAIGLKAITLWGLYYHNAILWERYGFTYFRGLKLMQRIHEGFQPGGELQRALDGSTPFRRPGMERTVRGRSWAIYDGLLEDVWEVGWEPPIMYKVLGRSFSVNTFPGQVY